MSETDKVNAVPTVVLICEAGLLGDGLASILENTSFRVAFRAAAFEAEELKSLNPKIRLFVLAGGQTSSETVETIQDIRSKHATAYIFVIGATTEPHEVRQALEAGADGFLGQTITSETLIMAIELALRDNTVLPAAFVKSMQRSNTLSKSDMSATETHPPALQSKSDLRRDDGERIVYAPTFSSKEEMILQLLAEGAANKLIAQRLSIAEATVKVHVKSILRKIRAKNRTQAAIWALAHFSPRALLTAHDHNANGHA